MDCISIIVPIYNAEQYLVRCIESMISQTYQRLEIILVNDGSKDGSLEICKAYAARDSRIVIIDKQNAGVALARNSGLEIASGKYIGFVDPDDWLETNMYERLLEGIKSSPYPICLCNYFKDTKKRSIPKYFGFSDTSLDANMVRKKIIPDMIGMDDLTPRYVYIMGCVWRGLYERRFIEANGLRFTPGITIMEDLVFMVQSLLKSNGVQIEQGVYYHYVQNPKSILHSYNKKIWEDQMRVHYLLEKSVREAGMETEVRNRLDLRYIGMVLVALRNEALIKNDHELKERFENIKEICTDEKLKLILERVKPIQMPLIREEEIDNENATLLGRLKELAKISNYTHNKKAKREQVSKKLKNKKRAYLKSEIRLIEVIKEKKGKRK
ncbi:glycosyltransferase [Cellulosilyticum ruminicola]|uniref:glycosyltransferase n=1 Tax=Cellulosilyticum ruminicola TaxID=425254 RepID=UPI0006D0922F|nr:glycosyltransferase [Cellulosilyticum ruminicola]